MHMHLLETAYQKEYAKRRGDCTALEYIDRFGMVNERLTLGHGVWLTEERHRPSGGRRRTASATTVASNFRLRSRRRRRSTPSRRTRHEHRRSGIDEAGINDDRDMLQEMRLVASRPSRAGHGGGGGADHGPGAAHGDRRRRAGRHPTARASAAWRSARPPTWSLHRLGRQVAYPYLDDAHPDPRRRRPARQERRPSP